MCWNVNLNCSHIHSMEVRIQRGGTGGPDLPPGKSQVLWVSIGNKQLDPPPTPGKSWTPPGKYWTPSGRFLWNWPFDFCKISWGLKKNVRAFIVPPDKNSGIRAWYEWRWWPRPTFTPLTPLDTSRSFWRINPKDVQSRYRLRSYKCDTKFGMKTLTGNPLG